MTDAPPPPAPGEPEPSVGTVLRVARERAGLTVDQVSESTRIRATLVRDLEADRFASSGAPVYARGHLRAIATAVGTDPVPLAARFDAQQGQSAPMLVEAEPVAARPAPGFGGSVLVPPRGVARERRGPRWGLAVAAAVAVLGTVLVVDAANSPRRAAAPLAGPSGAPVTSAPSPAPVRTPAPGSVAAKPVVTGAQLRVRLIGGTSWVSVRNATTTLFEGVLRPGDFKDFRDPARLRVTVGNAGAVDLNCGGRDSGPAGGSGKVLRFSCTKDGLAPA